MVSSGVFGRAVGWCAKRLDGQRIDAPERTELLAACGIKTNGGQWFRFGVMMALAAVIATMGLLADSSAVVIGAMLVAPLMTPVLGVAGALAMGWVRIGARMLAIVALATIGVIAIAFLIGTFTRRTDVSGEVLARTSPDLRDLGVALAAGAAGTYATVRRDLSSSLPGVAVAVALVPPLSAVGLTLSAERVDLARGASLLYLTNLGAIVLVGMFVFLLTGFVPLGRLRQAGSKVVFGVGTAILVVVALAVPLAIRSAKAISDAVELREVNQRIATWLEGNPDEIQSVSIGGKEVEVEIAGPTSPPPLGELQESLTEVFGTRPVVRVRWFQEDVAFDADQPAGEAPTSETPEERTASTAIDDEPVELAPEQVDEAVTAWLEAAGVAEAAEVTDRGVGDDTVTLTLEGIAEAPPSDLLVERLSAVAGRPISVELELVQTVDTSTTSTTSTTTSTSAVLPVETLVRAEVVAWGNEQVPPVELERLSTDDDSLIVDLAGAVPPPDATGLRARLEPLLEGRSLAVRFTQRVDLAT